jgi:hypothetical protein
MKVPVNSLILPFPVQKNVTMDQHQTLQKAFLEVALSVILLSLSSRVPLLSLPFNRILREVALSEPSPSWTLSLALRESQRALSTVSRLAHILLHTPAHAHTHTQLLSSHLTGKKN